MPHRVGALGRKDQSVSWDGTMNMPLYRLADPKHKDSHMMAYK
jgi:hypothetical protein